MKPTEQTEAEEAADWQSRAVAAFAEMERRKAEAKTEAQAQAGGSEHAAASSGSATEGEPFPEDCCEYCLEEFADLPSEHRTRDHIAPRNWIVGDFEELRRLIAPQGDLTEADRRIETLALYGWRQFISCEENTALACRFCNSAKSDRLPADDGLLHDLSYVLGFDIADSGFADLRGLWTPPAAAIGEIARELAGRAQITRKSWE